MPLTESQLDGIAGFKPSSPIEQIESVKEEEEEEEQNNEVRPLTFGNSMSA